MTWLLVVFLSETVQESVYFSDLDACLRIAQKIRSQNYDPSLAGIAKFGLRLIAFLNQFEKSRKNDGTNYK